MDSYGIIRTLGCVRSRFEAIPLENYWGKDAKLNYSQGPHSKMEKFPSHVNKEDCDLDSCT